MIAYLDCSAGISGDMLLGALIDVGWPEERLRDVVARLRIGEVQLATERVNKHGISATQVNVISSPQQPHRGFNDLVSIILQADFPAAIQERAIAAVTLLAEAESTVHNLPVEKIHFHEVGAVDTIVDIVGALVGMQELNVSEIYSSAMPWSRGTVKTEHGVLPVPPPAVAMLLRDVPVIGVDIDGETVTPTGATLARTLARQFGQMPAMTVSRVGYGAGQRDWPDRPNVLRLIIGQGINDSAGLIVEQLIQLSCNIDDMNPQWYAPLMKTLNDANALDVWLTAVQMKKDRPGTVVDVLCRAEDVETIRTSLLRHTTTLGLRQTSVTRYSLDRRVEAIETPYGRVRVKIAKLPDGTVKASPEHDDCIARATEHDVPVSEVWLAAAQAFGNS